MKTVYADSVLILNFIVDLSLLYITSFALGMRVKALRIAAASLIGGVFALAAEIFRPCNLVLYPLCVLVLYLMCKIAYGKRQNRVYIKSCIIIYILSFVLSGITVFIIFGLNDSKHKTLVLILALFLVYISLRFFGKSALACFESKRIEAFVEVNGIVYELYLMSDSGNVLVDVYTQKAVIVVKKESLTDFSESEGMIRLIPVSTVEGRGLMKVFTPSCVKVGNVQINAVIGISENGADFCGCDGVIPESLIRNL